MTVELSDEATKLVDEQVRAGRYPSRQAALEAPVARLREVDGAAEGAALDETRSLVDVGLVEADRGDFDDFTAEDVIAERRAAWSARPRQA